MDRTMCCCRTTSQARARSKAVEVCRIVFGRARTGPSPRRCRELPGFIHRPGVVWVGQSVLFLPSKDADELAGRLRGMGVRVRAVPIPVTLGTLQAFRRAA